jgi:ComF family protein
MIHDFINLLFPRTCLITKQPLAKREQYISTEARLSLPVLNYLNFNVTPLVHASWYLDEAYAYMPYSKGSDVGVILHAIKYRNAPGLATMLSRWFIHEWKLLASLDVDYVVPVPLHSKRLKTRGYNQSAYIAGELAKAAEAPLAESLMRRKRNTNTQTKKEKGERIRNVECAFELTQPVEGKHILLVDDVITTGATVSACAEELVKANAASVKAVALAFALQ